MLFYYDLIVCVWLFIVGACIGSFVNVVVYRLPRRIMFLKARSQCTACGVQLLPVDIIPVFSYIFLRGRCRRCGAKISVRYLAVEVFCGMLAILCWVRFGFDIMCVLAFGVCVILVAVTLIDFDTMEIPNVLVLALVPFAVCAVWSWGDISLFERVIGFFVISLPMFILALIISEAFGGGDIKLIAVCGFLLGWKNTLLAFFVAVLIAGIYAVYLIIRRRSKLGAHIAFGPYLCVGIAAALFWGTDIFNWYIGLLLF